MLYTCARISRTSESRKTLRTISLRGRRIFRVTPPGTDRTLNRENEENTRVPKAHCADRRRCRHRHHCRRRGRSSQLNCDSRRLLTVSSFFARITDIPWFFWCLRPASCTRPKFFADSFFFFS